MTKINEKEAGIGRPPQILHRRYILKYAFPYLRPTEARYKAFVTFETQKNLATEKTNRRRRKKFHFLKIF